MSPSSSPSPSPSSSPSPASGTSRSSQKGKNPASAKPKESIASQLAQRLGASLGETHITDRRPSVADRLADKLEASSLSETHVTDTKVDVANPQPSVADRLAGQLASALHEAHVADIEANVADRRPSVADQLAKTLASSLHEAHVDTKSSIADRLAQTLGSSLGLAHAEPQGRVAEKLAQKLAAGLSQVHIADTSNPETPVADGPIPDTINVDTIAEDTIGECTSPRAAKAASLVTKYRKAVAEEDAERMAAESSGKLGSTVSGTITPEAERLDIASSLASKLGSSLQFAHVADLPHPSPNSIAARLAAQLGSSLLSMHASQDNQVQLEPGATPQPEPSNPSPVVPEDTVTDVPIPDPSIADGRIPDENAGQSQPSRSGSRQVEFGMGATPNRFLEAHRSWDFNPQMRDTPLWPGLPSVPIVPERQQKRPLSPQTKLATIAEEPPRKMRKSNSPAGDSPMGSRQASPIQPDQQGSGSFASPIVLSSRDPTPPPPRVDSPLDLRSSPVQPQPSQPDQPQASNTAFRQLLAILGYPQDLLQEVIAGPEEARLQQDFMGFIENAPQAMAESTLFPSDHILRRTTQELHVAALQARRDVMIHGTISAGLQEIREIIGSWRVRRHDPDDDPLE